MAKNTPATKYDINRLLNRFPSLDHVTPRSPQAIAQQGQAFAAQMQREEAASQKRELQRARERAQARRDEKNNG